MLEDLKKIANDIRGDILDLAYQMKTPHIGSALSCIDILVVLYWNFLKIDSSIPDANDRDRFILSKGHAATALYSILCRRDFFSKELLVTYAKPGSKLIEHPVYKTVPGVEVTSGSLGHGLSLGLGIALAGRIQNEKFRVFVLLSDGECNEGSTWEAALFATANRVDSLAVIIDYNKWQATGRSNEVMALSPLRQKWEAFGWSSYEIDGHNLEEINQALKKFPDANGRPTVIIANTIKGKGVSFMEDDNNWHYRIPTEEEMFKAKKELGLL